MTIGTFHATFARVLRREATSLGFTSDFSIYDTYDRDAVVKLLMQEHKLDKDGVKPSPVGRRRKYPSSGSSSGRAA